MTAAHRARARRAVRRSPGRCISLNTSPAVGEARSESLRWISEALNPGVSVGTTKPRTGVPSSSVRAQITATSATVPLVIHILVPFKVQPAVVRRAVVRMAAGSDPASGSVSPKHPISSPAAMPGNQRSFCSSEP